MLREIETKDGHGHPLDIVTEEEDGRVTLIVDAPGGLAQLSPDEAERLADYLCRCASEARGVS